MELFVFLILFSIALPFLIVYLVNRSQRWALIPFYVLLVVSLVPWIESQVAGEWIAGYILYAIAVPFLLIFLLDRSRKWALIPAFSLIVIGTIPILTTRAEGELIAAFINLAIALPFLVAYLWTPRAWWALIPAGIMGSIAVGVGLLGIFGENVTTSFCLRPTARNAVSQPAWPLP